MANQATIGTSPQVPDHHPSCLEPSMAPSTDTWVPCSARDRPEAQDYHSGAQYPLFWNRMESSELCAPQLPSCGRGGRDQKCPQKDNICSLLCSFCGLWGLRQDTAWGQPWTLRLAYTDPGTCCLCTGQSKRPFSTRTSHSTVAIGHRKGLRVPPHQEDTTLTPTQAICL